MCRHMHVRVHAKMIFGAFFFWLKKVNMPTSTTETTTQRYLWLYRRAVVKGIQIFSPLFIRILKGEPLEQFTIITLKRTEMQR